MDRKEIIAVVTVVLVLVLAFYALTPGGRANWNNWMAQVQQADDQSRYSTKKQVEDTCRAMIASYESDRLTYQEYKDSTNEEKQSWAESAKIRANKTAASYNEYILKNTYVWDGNIPNDIHSKLDYIGGNDENANEMG